MDGFDLDALLEAVDTDAKDEFASMPPVEDWDGTLDVSTLPIKVRKWIRVPDVVAVVADLKGSTHLGTGKNRASTASIYQAATGGVVRIYDQFNADFIAIQGDGAFALFWSDDRYQRAMCAGITVKTFSQRDLIRRLENKWDDPEHRTGFKVGIASGRVLVKRIGTPRNPAQQEPIWAGKPVNYAAKAAQQADRHELIIAGSIWDKIENNDYLTISCGCRGGGSGHELWADVTIEKVPEKDSERYGRLLSSTWCAEHGEEFCAAILNGETKRDNVDAVRGRILKAQQGNVLRSKAARDRSEHRRLRSIGR